MIGEYKLHEISKHEKPIKHQEVQPTDEELERHGDVTNPRAKAKAKSKARYRYEERMSKYGRKYKARVGLIK